VAEEGDACEGTPNVIEDPNDPKPTEIPEQPPTELPEEQPPTEIPEPPGPKPPEKPPGKPPGPNKPRPPPPKPSPVGALDGVMVAFWPTPIRPIWVSSTFRFTTNEPLLITWICGVEDAELPVAPPADPPPPDAQRAPAPAAPDQDEEQPTEE
jgi:hypothetical protein